MKREIKFLGWVLMALIGVTMVSCSSDDSMTDSTGSNGKTSGILPAKASDLSVTSNGYLLASSAGTRAGIAGETTTDTLARTPRVEVNLSINAEKVDGDNEVYGDFIASHLSIHVRDTSDVEVFIPVKAEYYCEVGNMATILSHKSGVGDSNNITSSKDMTFDVNGNTVKLTVTYELGGIRITTSGIKADVLKYLRKTYGDGMVFEVWNYYKSNVVDAAGAVLETLDRTKIQALLNTSKVLFDTDPDLYVNAFGAVYDYTGTVYSKVVDGVYTPYTDKGLTAPLATIYWDRDPNDSRYYILKSHINDLDCIVTPVNTAFSVIDTVVFSQVYKK